MQAVGAFSFGLMTGSWRDLLKDDDSQIRDRHKHVDTSEVQLQREDKFRELESTLRRAIANWTSCENWIDVVMELVEPIVPKDFFGKLEINIQGGSIANVNVTQTFRKESRDGDNQYSKRQRK